MRRLCASRISGNAGATGIEQYLRTSPLEEDTWTPNSSLFCGTMVVPLTIGAVCSAIGVLCLAAPSSEA